MLEPLIHRAALVRAIAAFSYPAMASAQSGKGLKATEVMEACARNRVSESVGENHRTRKSLGRPTEQICREWTDAWLQRLAAWQTKGDPVGALRDALGTCKDLAERLAGRPIEIAWCSRWGDGRGLTFDPPDEIWTALDIAHSKGGVDRSALVRAVKELLERRLAADWDQVQVRDHLRSMGPWCEIKADLKTSICSVNIHENFRWQPHSQSMVVVVTRVIATVRFDTEQAPGTRQIEVTTARAAL